MMRKFFRSLVLLTLVLSATSAVVAQTTLKAGTYYIQNVATGQYISAGATAGYRGILREHGIEFKVTKSGTSYKLITDLNQVGRMLKSADGYVDGENDSWQIEPLEDGTYAMYSASQSAYYGYDPTNEHPWVLRFLSSKDTENTHWRFWTKAALQETLSTATLDHPVDATFLIKAPDFLRGDQRIYTDHCWGEDLTALNGNKSSSTYLVNTYNGEMYDRASFNVSQTLTGIPNGLYKVMVQGFYRYGGAGTTSGSAFLNGTEEPLVQLYAADKSVPLMSLYAQAQQTQSEGFNRQVTGVGYVPDTQEQAAACFSDNYYVNTLADIFIIDGTLTLGIRKSDKAVSADWACFDNFTLFYYGNDSQSIRDAALKTWSEYAAKTVEGGDAATYQATLAQLKVQIQEATDAAVIHAAIKAMKVAWQVYQSSPAVTGIPLDLTSLLVNADFKQGTTGWTVTANKPANVKVDATLSPAVIEAYAGLDALDLKTYSILQEQDITLAAGTYRLSAYAFYRYSTAYNSDRANPKTYAALVAGEHRQDVMRLGDLQLSSYANSMAEAAAAFSAGNYLNELIFHLDAPTTLSIGFEGTHRVRQSWFAAGPVRLEKVSENQVLEKYLVRWDTFKSIAAQALDHSAFDAVLAEAQTHTTEEELQAADARVYEAFCTLLSTGTTAIGLFDLTCYLRNTTFDEGKEGWLATSEVKWGDMGVAETFSQANNLIYQTLPDMPAGRYTVKVQAFHRTSDTSTSNAAYESGKDPVAAQLFIGKDAINVKNINDEARYLSALPSDDVAGPAQRSIPISLTGANAAFKKGMYWNVLSTELQEAGDLTLGLRVTNGKSANWLPFDNFRLYYGNNVPTVNLSATEPYTITEDTRANVRSDIPLKADIYNKVCLPFDMTKEQVAATFTGAYSLGGVTTEGETLQALLIPVTHLKAGEAYFVQVATDQTLAADDVLLRAFTPDSIPVIWSGAATQGRFSGCTFDLNLEKDYKKIANGESLNCKCIDFSNVEFTTNLENWQIRRFLNDNTYTKESASVVGLYHKAPPAHRDQPHSVFIPVPETEKAFTVTVEAVDGSTLKQQSAISFPAGTTLCEVPNLIPQQDYTYKAETADGTVITQGRFHTEGHLRMIKANSGSNIRDLGGWLNTDGNRIRYGLIYRGGELNGGHTMNSADLKELKRLGIGAEVDLREDKDVDNKPFTRSAIGADVLYTYENLSQWEVDALTTQTAKLKDAFDLVMQALRQDRATYFHCIWGADRTGCFALLLEGLLGLPVDQLYKDYELTSYSIAGTRVKTNLDAKLNYINTLPGKTLQHKFFHYWNRQVGISVQDLVEFIERMVDGESSITHSALNFDATANTYYQTPATIPVMCSIGSTVVPGAKALLQKVGEETITELDLSIDGNMVRLQDIALEPSSRYTVTIPAGTIDEPITLNSPLGACDASLCEEPSSLNPQLSTLNSQPASLTFRTPLFFDGDFYLYLPSLSKFLSRGEKWSTRITADNYGLPAAIATNERNVTTVRFLDSNLYMGSDSYTDKAPDFNSINWTLERAGKNYILRSANGYYLKMTSTGASSVDGASAADAVRISMVTLPEQQAAVAATSQKNIMAALKAAGIQTATWEEAQEALTHLVPTTTKVAIKNAKTGNPDVWVLTEPENAQAVSPTEYNTGSYGGELYQRCGTVTQTVEVPNEGLYRLTLNALFRSGPAERCYALGEQGYELSNAWVSVNTTYFAQIPSWYSDCASSTKPNTAATARTLMNNGKYAMEVYAYIGKAKKATITVHVPGYVADGWCLFNNFALTELVDESVGIHDLPNPQDPSTLNPHPSSLSTPIYDLSGRPIVNRKQPAHGTLDTPNAPIQKGLYITRGKKVIVK